MELEKLDKVAMLARSEENRAAGTLHKNQQALDQSAARLAQLEAFKREYEQRLEAIASSGIDARQLVDYRRFLQNLNDAISVQGKETHRSESELQSSRDALVDRSLRRSTVDELISRGRVSLLREENKREQRQSDELTLQRHEHDS